ncbi:hypothetical protein BT63DRAFT_419895 [Microthyrium microscopicum]|uniref:ER membrane protein complex subunit 6 n=1 Tax=Microthyrium microscopicum TaxID=703497 RepID=A0A6A6UT56_9PEZI|nr:hypothetical protein BT63DRAFT_419895 [Microthyrium microscopicum]
MFDEHELAIHPLVPESVQHNVRVISNIRSLSASLIGAVAGTLGLESYPGFAFYLLGTVITSLLIYIFLAEGNVKRYFFRPTADLWMGDMFGSFMSFVLTWTLFYGMVRT